MQGITSTVILDKTRESEPRASPHTEPRASPHPEPRASITPGATCFSLAPRYTLRETGGAAERCSGDFNQIKENKTFWKLPSLRASHIRVYPLAASLTEPRASLQNGATCFSPCGATCFTPWGKGHSRKIEGEGIPNSESRRHARRARIVCGAQGSARKNLVQPGLDLR